MLTYHISHLSQSTLPLIGTAINICLQTWLGDTLYKLLPFGHTLARLPLDPLKLLTPTVMNPVCQVLLFLYLLYSKYTQVFIAHFMTLLVRLQKTDDRKLGESEIGNNMDQRTRVETLQFIVDGLNHKAIRVTPDQIVFLSESHFQYNWFVYHLVLFTASV